MAKYFNVVFTVNNYTEDEYNFIFSNEAFKYIIIGKEVGEQETPHLQGYACLKKQMRHNALKKLLPRAHFEKRRGTHLQAREYCMKDGDYAERGDQPHQGERTDIKKAVQLIKEGKSMTTIANDCSEVYVKYSRGLRDLALAVQSPYTHATVRGIWIYGEPGTGKSHAARQFDNNAYIKAQNKWWDGYAGESTVLLDDLDTNTLGHYLKIWSDRWPCTGETKGGTIQLRHHLFIITSNYSIEELFNGDLNMCAAIARRFKVVHKTDRNQIVDFLIV